MRVLVVDETRVHREWLVQHLDAEPSIVDAAGAADIETARSLVGLNGCRVALVNMTTAGSLAICKELASDARVIALISGADDEVVACAEAGVSGYVLRDQSYDELFDAVASVARGEMPCPPRVAAALLRRVGTRVAAAGHQTPTGTGRLTRRERQILDLIDRGLSNKEIARQLSIEVRTVKNHVHNMLEKLGVRRRGEASALLRGRTAPPWA